MSEPELPGEQIDPEDVAGDYVEPDDGMQDPEADPNVEPDDDPIEDHEEQGG